MNKADLQRNRNNIFAIGVTTFSASLFANPSYSQEYQYLCGGSCVAYERQIGIAQRLDSEWIKALVQQTVFVDNKPAEAGMRVPPNEKHWLFANCTKSLFGVGYKSDGTDANISSVFTEEGTPKEGGYHYGVYGRWRELCRQL